MKITPIFQDLSHYEYDDMVRKSMHLLNRYYSAHHNLFRRAVQAQVSIILYFYDVTVTGLQDTENISHSSAGLQDNFLNFSKT